MIRIILHGCRGAMGKVITDLVKEEPDFEITCGVDAAGPDDSLPYPVVSSFDQCTAEGDVIVDFSIAPAVDGLLAAAAERKLPLVLCTTGLSEAQLQAVQEASRVIPVLRSANMSLGINTVFKLAAQAAAILAGRGYDIEILEKHHHRKLDAPSGTALAIADAINEAMDGKYTYKLDRSADYKKRDADEIGIQALRGGNIVGEHEVYFCGTDEVIEIKHTAYSRAIFGKGALSAAAFLIGKKPGMYRMADVIG